jgi:hypothetical protein
MAALQNAVLRGEMGTQPEISEVREHESPVLKISSVPSGNNHLHSHSSRAVQLPPAVFLDSHRRMRGKVRKSNCATVFSILQTQVDIERRILKRVLVVD